MPTHLQYTAWLRDHLGNPAVEIATTYENNTVSCFVPATIGKSFSVHWKDNGSMQFSSGYIVVDGVAAPGRFLAGRGETFRSGIRSGPNTEIPFQFSKTISTPPKDGDPSGTIVLKIMLSERGEGVPNNDPKELISASEKIMSNTDNEDMPEKPPQRDYLPQHPLTWSGKPAGGGPPRSHVKFFFHYRIPQWLIDNGFLFAPSYLPPMVTDIPKQAVLFPLSTVSRPIEEKSDSSYDSDEDSNDEGSDEEDPRSEYEQDVDSATQEARKSFLAALPQYAIDGLVDKFLLERENVPNKKRSSKKRMESRYKPTSTPDPNLIAHHKPTPMLDKLPSNLIEELVARYKPEMEEQMRLDDIARANKPKKPARQKAASTPKPRAKGKQRAKDKQPSSRKDNTFPQSQTPLPGPSRQDSIVPDTPSQPRRELTIAELKEKYKVEMAEQMRKDDIARALKKAKRQKAVDSSWPQPQPQLQIQPPFQPQPQPQPGSRPKSQTQSQPQPQPQGQQPGLAQMQQHPRSSNAYVFPTHAGSIPRPGPERQGPYPISQLPMQVIPGRTASGRPSAIIDTRMIGRAIIAAQSPQSTMSSSSTYPQYPPQPGPSHSYDGSNHGS